MTDFKKNDLIMWNGIIYFIERVNKSSYFISYLGKTGNRVKLTVDKSIINKEARDRDFYNNVKTKSNKTRSKSKGKKTRRNI